MGAPTEITDVLGRTRPVVYSWPDGAWNCPFCFSAMKGGTECEGPGCLANPRYPVERAREELAKAEARDREEKQRKANHEWAMKRAEEERQAREVATTALRQLAIQSGACVRCALHQSNYKKKLVRHRGACPRDGR